MNISLPSNFIVFIFIILALNTFPTIYIIFTKDISDLYGISNYDSYLEAANTLLICNIVVLFFFITSYIVFSKKIFLIIEKKTAYEQTFFYKRYFKIRPVFLFLSIVSVGSFFYLIGFSKLSLLGSGVDAWEFRMIGFDDTPRILQAANEAARRILLPLLLIIEYSNIIVNKTRKKLTILIIGTYIIGIISTLDRAPMLTLFVLFAYAHLLINPSKFKFIFTSVLSIFLIGIIAAVTTYIQYNILEFNLEIILSTMQDFFLHRVLLVPSIAAIQLSFENFPIGADFLYLKYSRLGALFGADYVGTEQDLSLYVTPVGFIGDVWRNLGFIGIFFVSIFLGFFSAWLDKKTINSYWQVSLAISFLYFAFILFLIFGVFFSQGSFMQIIFLVFVSSYLGKNKRKSNA